MENQKIFKTIALGIFVKIKCTITHYQKNTSYAMVQG